MINLHGRVRGKVWAAGHRRRDVQKRLLHAPGQCPLSAWIGLPGAPFLSKGRTTGNFSHGRDRFDTGDLGRQ
jgi:hypothetical protein